MNKAMPVTALMIMLAMPSAAMAAESTTIWNNGVTTSSSTSRTVNEDGSVTRDTTVTGPAGKTVTRSATRGNGMTTIQRANGRMRTTLRNH